MQGKVWGHHLAVKWLDNASHCLYSWKNNCLILQTQLTACDQSFFLTKCLFDGQCVPESTESSHCTVKMFTVLKPFLNKFLLSN
jgi:hypothetical protein